MHLVAGFLAMALCAVPMAGRALEAYRWQARLVLVFAEPGDPRIAAQTALLGSASAAVADRDTVVLVDTDPASDLRARFRPSGFTVVLVGKDGGEKLRNDRITEPSEIAALIDTMPMRRREMRLD